MIIFFYKKEGENMHRKTRILSLMIINLFIFSLTTFTFAGGVDPVSIVGSGPDLSGVDTLYGLGNTILGILQYVGGGVAIIAAIVLGMKYMYSSPDAQAEIKKKLMPFIIGGVLVFGATSLVKIVETFVGEII